MPPDFASLRDVLDWLPMEEQRVYAQSMAPYASDSAAASEAKETDGEAIHTAVTQSRLHILSTGDHLVALHRALEPEMLTFSPWTIARTILEFASWALWILDEDCDVETRLSRSLMLRLVNVEDQMRLVDPSDPDSESVKAGLRERRKEILGKAKRLGLTVSRAKGGKRRVQSIGNISRSFSTNVVQEVLAEGWAYRLLSGAEHQRSWASLNLSMRKVEGLNLITPELKEPGWLFLVSGALRWFSTATWRYYEYCGFATDELEAIFQEARRRTGLRDGFWEVASPG